MTETNNNKNSSAKTARSRKKTSAAVEAEELQKAEAAAPTGDKPLKKRTSGRKQGIDVVVSRAVERIMAADKAADASAKQADSVKPARSGRAKAGKAAKTAAVDTGEQTPAASESRVRKAAAKSAAKPAPKAARSLKATTDLAPGAKRSAARGAHKSGESFKLKVIPLGGLGEIGKNMTLIEYGGDILVIDGGLAFPDESMLGIDLVIPDHSYLLENKDKVRAYLLTHGHEDHIGAMPYLLPNVPAPVYGLPLTLGLLRGKLNERHLDADLRPVSPREELTIGHFRLEFIRVTHSIPDSMGLAIHTPVGVILVISDFKMDMSPIDGQLMDFGRISALGEKGVLLLMSDSTNVERPGFSDSERSVGYNLDKIFFSAKGRIILASFASHVHRVQQAVWAAQRTGRKVAVCGRGMQNMVAVASQMGYLDLPDKTLIGIDEIGDYPAGRVVVITTGSQGEPLSGLTRMASGEHKQVQIMAGDTVVISATPIPGNERTVARTVDNLFRLGANVIHERSQGIHVSGHACQEELKVLLNMVKPRFFLPIHGEYRMLYKHAQLAQSIGMPAENTIVMENGQVLELSRRNFRLESSVPSGRILIDGLGVGDVGGSVLRERRQLSEGGVVVISLVYTKDKGREARVLIEPEISTRGFIFEKDYEHIIVEIKEKVAAICTEERLCDGSLHDLRNQVRSAVGKLILERTGRRPVIMAALFEV